MKADAKRAAIYARVSTDDKDQNPEIQVRACKEKATALGCRVVSTFVDEQTGQRQDRPGYTKLIQAARDKAVDVILIRDLSRINRDDAYGEIAMREIERLNVRIVTCDGSYDSSTSETMRLISRKTQGLMNSMHRVTLATNVLNKHTTLAQDKYWCGGRVYGYKLVRVRDAKRKDQYGDAKAIGTRLKSDAKQAAIVLEIFRRYVNGETPQTIAADLNARKVPSPGTLWENRKVRRCAGWARSAIWQMLVNPLYSGTYYWKRSRWQWVTKQNENGELVTTRCVSNRPAEDRIGEEGNAPELRIVSPDIWKRAQARRNANKAKADDKRLRSGGKAVYLLSGVLRCSCCDSRFVMDSRTHYRCGKALDGKGCKNLIRVRREVAERVILGPITDRLLAPQMIADMVKEMHRYYAQRAKATKAAESSRPAEVKALDERIARLRERAKTGDDDMTPDELLAVVEKAETKRAALLAAEPAARFTAKVLQAIPTAAKQYRDQITKGMAGNRTELARARVAVRKLLGERVTLKPAPGGKHLMAHMQFQRAALLGSQMAVTGSVGSGGRI